MAHGALDACGIDARVCGVLDDEGQRITDLLDEVTDEVLDALGEDKNAAARQWGRALGHIA